MDREKFFVWCAVKRHLCQMSIKHTRIRYNVLFKWLDKKRLTPDTAELFILYLREKNLRNQSINTYIRIINLIDIYERENNKDLNLLKKISYFPKQKKVPTILSVDEIKAILRIEKDYSKRPYRNLNHDIDRTYHNAIWFLAATGCRYSEMALLKRESLQLGVGGGYVIFKDTKTLEDRQVPLPPLLVNELKSFVGNKNPSNYVFTTSTGKPITEQSFTPELRSRAKLADIEKHIYPHCFRNSYIREHRRSGTDILTLAKLVGHRDPKTTLGYDKFEYDDLLKGAENHPLFSEEVPTDKILQKYFDLIDQWPVKHDNRFLYKTVKENNRLMVELAAI